MNSGTIIGGAIGLQVGGAIGVIIPGIDVLPPEWRQSYENNIAIFVHTFGYGAVGGSTGGAICGTISHNLIHDGGVIGGVIGGIAGGSLTTTLYIYKWFTDSQKIGKI
jgi:hypothetical protein